MVQSGCLFVLVDLFVLPLFFFQTPEALGLNLKEETKKSFRKNRHLREESVAAAGRNWIRKKPNNNKHFNFFHNDLNFLSTLLSPLFVFVFF